MYTLRGYVHIIMNVQVIICLSAVSLDVIRHNLFDFRMAFLAVRRVDIMSRIDALYI